MSYARSNTNESRAASDAGRAHEWVTRMRITAIREGDIVAVSRQGRIFHALVSGREGKRLAVSPIERGVSYSTASAREVLAHWARRGRPRTPGAPTDADPPLAA